MLDSIKTPKVFTSITCPKSRQAWPRKFVKTSAIGLFLIPLQVPLLAPLNSAAVKRGRNVIRSSSKSKPYKIPHALTLRRALPPSQTPSPQLTVPLLLPPARKAKVRVRVRRKAKARTLRKYRVITCRRTVRVRTVINANLTTRSIKVPHLPLQKRLVRKPSQDLRERIPPLLLAEAAPCHVTGGILFHDTAAANPKAKGKVAAKIVKAARSRHAIQLRLIPCVTNVTTQKFANIFSGHI